MVVSLCDEVAFLIIDVATELSGLHNRFKGSDVGRINGELDEYLGSLKGIFSRCLEGGFDTICMTPNMLNTHFAEGTPEQYIEYAHKTADMQNGGRMDLYIGSAVKLAEEMGVTVCDCYAEWKKLSETEDVTMLLANRINHPTEEMHALFADKLFEMIMSDGGVSKENDDTMFKG